MKTGTAMFIYHLQQIKHKEMGQNSSLKSAADVSIQPNKQAPRLAIEHD
jgi:hypothetical protein